MHRIIVTTCLLFGGLATMQAQATLLGPFSHTWTGTEATEPSRIFRDGVPSTCASPKPFPGTVGGTNFLDTLGFFNTGASAECVTVSVTEDIHSFISAYLGSFDPANLATHYLGDQGLSVSNTFSFTVPGLTAFTIVANTAFGAGSIGHNFSYTVEARNVAAAGVVPEPATLALLCLGLAGLGFSRPRNTN